MRNAKAFAVIGAGWGDEGKGLTVDAIAAREGAALVVRTNGGAQAGHTVQLDDGRRHVFSHFASGALAGAASHLARQFVVNPILFEEERNKLSAAGGCLDISVSPDAIVTTPFDMMLNQMAEESRGARRHGSCGIGFGETIERSTFGPKLTVRQLRTPGTVRKILSDIWSMWLWRRMAKLGLEPTANLLNLGSSAAADRFVRACEFFISHVRIVADSDVPLDGPVVIEGAQGLMLDQHHGAFPHVTRSSTGLVNMLAFASAADITELETFYVTRAYATRHGHGPFHDHHNFYGFDVVDDTNRPGLWQGQMRLAPLRLSTLAAAVQWDLGFKDWAGVDVRPSMVITCLDQGDGSVPLLYDEMEVAVPIDEVAWHVARAVNLEASESRGPTRSTFVFSRRRRAAAAA